MVLQTHGVTVPPKALIRNDSVRFSTHYLRYRWGYHAYWLDTAYMITKWTAVFRKNQERYHETPSHRSFAAPWRP